jgi:uncharacterized protein (TIGR04255 family)
VTRPKDLCEFDNPPLNEVVLGLQFAPPVGYQQIRAGEVWALFRESFPNVMELPPLPPAFETFGPVHTAQLNLAALGAPMPTRYWFLSQSGDELVQFQSDRLLHNWRKVGDGSNRYPRFEAIVAKFEDELRRLEAYYEGLHPQSLIVQQCEISYINRIEMPGDRPIVPSEWLTFLSVPGQPPEDFTAVFRRIITADGGSPQGRLFCEAATSYQRPSEKFLGLTLTARGVPARQNLASALDFIHRGREMIVRLFAEVTTDSAHKIWGRTQ